MSQEGSRQSFNRAPLIRPRRRHRSLNVQRAFVFVVQMKMTMTVWPGHSRYLFCSSWTYLVATWRETGCAVAEDRCDKSAYYFP